LSEVATECSSEPVVNNYSVTFSEAGRSYAWSDIGPDATPSVNTSLVADPDQAGDTVAYSLRNGAGPGINAWNGTLFVATEDGSDVGFSFAEGDRIVSMRVRSGAADKPVSLKFEQVGSGTGAVLAKAFTTVADQWETLYFDFGSPAEGGVSDTAKYAKVIVIYDQNSAESADQTFYFDDITYGGVQLPADTGPIIALPIDFEEAVSEYTLSEFAGGVVAIVKTPDLTTNALKYVKYSGETWGGVQLTLDTPINFANGYKFNVDVIEVESLICRFS
jgi:hypothetical protein